MRLAERISSRLSGIFGGGIVKRTVLCASAFGLGSLLVVWLLSLGFVSLAEGLLPRPGSTAAATGSALLPAASGTRTPKATDLTAPKRRGIGPRIAPTDNAGPGGPPGLPGSPPQPADDLSQNPAGPVAPTAPPPTNQAPRKAGEQSL